MTIKAYKILMHIKYAPLTYQNYFYIETFYTETYS